MIASRSRSIMDADSCVINIVEDYLDLETLIVRVKAGLLTLESFTQILVRNRYALATMRFKNEDNGYLPASASSYKVLSLDQYQQLEEQLQTADFTRLN